MNWIHSVTRAVKQANTHLCESLPNYEMNNFWTATTAATAGRIKGDSTTLSMILLFYTHVSRDAEGHTFRNLSIPHQVPEPDTQR